MQPMHVADGRFLHDGDVGLGSLYIMKATTCNVHTLTTVACSSQSDKHYLSPYEPFPY